MANPLDFAGGLTQTDIFGLGTGIAGTAGASAAYNIAAYFACLQLRQNQIYQDKNYHLSWVSVARDDIRSVMDASTNRMNNYILVGTLILQTAIGMLFGDNLVSSGNFFIIGIYWQTTALSILFFTTSIMLSVKGQNCAFLSTTRLLSWETRPENPAPYDHDYMHQVEAFERNGTWQVFRIPGMGRTRFTQEEHKSGTGDAKQGKKGGSAASASDFEESGSFSGSAEIPVPLRPPGLPRREGDSASSDEGGATRRPKGGSSAHPKGSTTAHSVGAADGAAAANAAAGASGGGHGGLEELSPPTYELLYLARMGQCMQIWLSYDTHSKYCFGFGLVLMVKGAIYWSIGMLFTKDTGIADFTACTTMVIFTYVNLVIYRESFKNRWIIAQCSLYGLLISEPTSVLLAVFYKSSPSFSVFCQLLNILAQVALFVAGFAWSILETQRPSQLAGTFLVGPRGQRFSDKWVDPSTLDDAGATSRHRGHPTDRVVFEDECDDGDENDRGFGGEGLRHRHHRGDDGGRGSTRPEESRGRPPPYSLSESDYGDLSDSTRSYSSSSSDSSSAYSSSYASSSSSASSPRPGSRVPRGSRRSNHGRAGSSVLGAFDGCDDSDGGETSSWASHSPKRRSTTAAPSWPWRLWHRGSGKRRSRSRRRRSSRSSDACEGGRRRHRPRGRRRRRVGVFRECWQLLSSGHCTRSFHDELRNMSAEERAVAEVHIKVAFLFRAELLFGAFTWLVSFVALVLSNWPGLGIWMEGLQSAALIPEVVPMSWHHPLFRPSALACAPGRKVFAANAFVVASLDLEQGVSEIYPCQGANRTIRDIMVACDGDDGSGCRPLVLLNDSRIVDCLTGVEPELLMPSASAMLNAQRIAFASSAEGGGAGATTEGSIAAPSPYNGTLLLASDAGIVQCAWRPVRNGWYPLWQLRPEDALMVAPRGCSTSLLGGNDGCREGPEAPARRLRVRPSTRRSGGSGGGGQTGSGVRRKWRQGVVQRSGRIGTMSGDEAAEAAEQVVTVTIQSLALRPSGSGLGAVLFEHVETTRGWQHKNLVELVEVPTLDLLGSWHLPDEGSPIIAGCAYDEDSILVLQGDPQPQLLRAVLDPPPDDDDDDDDGGE